MYKLVLQKLIWSLFLLLFDSIKMSNWNKGEVAERLKALVLKTSDGATRSWVRIPPSPPIRI